MSYSNSTQTTGNQQVDQKNLSTVLTPEQQALLKSQTNFATGIYNPALAGVIGNAQNQYAQGLGSVVNNSNLYGTNANQLGQQLSGSGANGFNTATQGLSSLFSPDYLQNQINAATGTGNLQYQQNLANQAALYGGAGQLGSARQYLAGNQLAETQRANNAQIGANIANNVANQQIQAGQTLGQLGLGGAQQGLNAYKSAIEASSLPLSYTKTYGDIIYGVPSSASSPNFSGTQGQNSSAISNQINSINKVDTDISGKGVEDLATGVSTAYTLAKDSGLVGGLGDLYKDFKNWWSTPTPSPDPYTTPGDYYIQPDNRAY